MRKVGEIPDDITKYATIAALIIHFDWGYAANGTTLLLLFGNECGQIDGAVAVLLELPGAWDAQRGIYG